LQAVLWYYEQSLYSKQGVPKESWSFRDAAQRAAKEEAARAPEQGGFNFGENQSKAGLEGLNSPKTKVPGAMHAFDFLNALKK
jgi:hypothetical protein